MGHGASPEKQFTAAPLPKKIYCKFIHSLSMCRIVYVLSSENHKMFILQENVMKRLAEVKYMEVG